MAILSGHGLALNLVGVRELKHKSLTHADGKTPQSFKITSVKTWKRDLSRIRIGLKRGLYQYETIESVDEFMKHFNI